MKIVPARTHVERVSKTETYIRYGQLNNDNKLDGIGRKMTLKPKF